MTIGIDFGTTKTIVSWANPRNGHVETIKCFNHKDQIPTCVFVNKNGECVFGEPARLAGMIDIRLMGEIQVGAGIERTISVSG